MGKSVIIVESAAKTRTIGGFLGGEYQLEASLGHVRDLPERDLGVDVDHGFQPSYQIMPDKQDVVRKLKAACKSADRVYLATDPDREGEAIAWHLEHALGLKKAYRIEFNEITRTAVQEALEHPREIDLDRVNAQQARRILDRLVGYKISPLLWRKNRNARSAGRVQSVAVRLIVEREREIRAFEPVEYWRIGALLSPADRPAEQFEARLEKVDGQKIEVGDIGDEARATALVTQLQAAALSVAEITVRNSTRRPQPPYITSTLQRDASTRLGFRANRTMQTAQRLYEGVPLGDGETVGLITYMRTDSTRVAGEAAAVARQLIADRWGQAYVGSGQRGKAVKAAQDAHECIRPTYPDKLSPDELDQRLPGRENSDLRRLYRLIWERFIASQMAPAKLRTTTVDVAAGPHTLRASGTEVTFAGYMALTGVPQPRKTDEEDDEERDDDLGRRLPELAEGEPVTCHDLTPSQHFTQPPPRYSEATLVKTLEERGIGRPSTYAPTLQTITQRRYVKLEKNRFEPTKLGEAVTDALVEHFPEFMDLDFTASLENELDEVERGRRDWVKLVAGFYGPLEEQIAGAYDALRIRVEAEETEHDCPKCGAKMLRREGRYGEFLGCSRYPDCDGILRLGRDGQPVPVEGEPTEHDCPECGAKLRRVEGRWGPYLRCERHPDCAGKMRLDRQGQPVAATPAQATEIACPECQAPMVLRSSRRGPFLGCSRYPKCRGVRQVDDKLQASLTAAGVTLPAATARPAAQPTSLTCDQCGSPLVLRTGRRGPFLGCGGYPKCRNIVNLTDELREQLRAEGLTVPD